MLLKGFLLIGFVLNAFCLNNLSGEFLSPKYDLRKNESLVESLEKDPSSFVELFAKADNDTINRVIGILEGLIADASSAEVDLRSHVTDATNTLETKNNDLVTANNNVRDTQSALEQANADHLNAVTEQTTAENAQGHAQSQKELADGNYADGSPGLINEQQILREVIVTLRGLNDGDSYLFDTRNIDGCGCKMSDNSYPATAWYYLNNFNEQVLMEFCQARCNEMDSCEAIALKIPQSICHIYFINGLWPARPNSFNVVSNGVVGGWTKGIRNNCEGANNGCYYKSNLA